MNNSLYLYTTGTSYLPAQTTEPPRKFTKDIVVSGWHSPTQGIVTRPAARSVPMAYTRPLNAVYDASNINAPSDIETDPDVNTDNLQRIGV